MSNVCKKAVTVQDVLRRYDIISKYTDFLIENVVDEYADIAVERTKEYIENYPKKGELKNCKTYEEALHYLIENGDEELKKFAVDYYKEWIYDYVDEFCEMNDLSDEDSSLIKRTNPNNFIGSKIVLSFYCQYYVEDYLYEIPLN
jgi:hypothetical protein